MAEQLSLLNESECQEKKEVERKAHVKAYQKEYRKKNRERLNALHRKYWHAKIDKEEYKRRKRERYSESKKIRENVAKRQKEYRATIDFKVRSKVYQSEWLQRPGVKKRRNKRRAERRMIDPKYKLICTMRKAIGESIKTGKNRRCFKELVPYTIEKLKKHLEKLFKPGMSWDNYGTDWEIDHKIPISVFNFKSPDDIDFSRCWKLKNLQPLWSPENRAKSANLTKHFQPSLAF